MDDGTYKKPLFNVRTCATSANMGPGYDTAALALDIFNECGVFKGSGGSHSVEYFGPYSNDIDNQSSLVINALNMALEKFKDRIRPPSKKHDGDKQEEHEAQDSGDDGDEKMDNKAVDTEMDAATKEDSERPGRKEENKDGELPGSLDIKMTVNIPPGKGLGSSASAVIAGLLIANKAYNMGLNKRQLFQTAAELESSPDNAAAALSGGMALVYRSGAEYLFEKIELSKDYKILLFIPFGTASTEKARKLVPGEVPIRDAVDNIAGFSLMLKYLEEGDLKAAAAFCKDYMYQKYRKALYPASIGLVEELTETYKLPAFISGAGPAVAAIMDEEMFSMFKDIRGKITAEYLSFQSMVAGICENGSYYL